MKRSFDVYNIRNQIQFDREAKTVTLEEFAFGIPGTSGTPTQTREVRYAAINNQVMDALVISYLEDRELLRTRIQVYSVSKLDAKGNPTGNLTGPFTGNTTGESSMASWGDTNIVYSTAMVEGEISTWFRMAHAAPTEDVLEQLSMKEMQIKDDLLRHARDFNEIIRK